MSTKYNFDTRRLGMIRDLVNGNPNPYRSFLNYKNLSGPRIPGNTPRLQPDITNRPAYSRAIMMEEGTSYSQRKTYQALHPNEFNSRTQQLDRNMKVHSSVQNRPLNDRFEAIRSQRLNRSAGSGLETPIQRQSMNARNGFSQTTPNVTTPKPESKSAGNKAIGAGASVHSLMNTARTVGHDLINQHLLNSKHIVGGGMEFRSYEQQNEMNQLDAEKRAAANSTALDAITGGIESGATLGLALL